MGAANPSFFLTGSLTGTAETNEAKGWSNPSGTGGTTPGGELGHGQNLWTAKWGKTDTTPPVLEGVALCDTTWQVDGHRTYTITVTASDSGSGVLLFRMLINFQGSNNANKRGLFAWRADLHHFNEEISTDRIDCLREDEEGVVDGYAEKYNGNDGPPPGFGKDYIDLVECTTRIDGNSRTVTFRVRPHEDFGDFDNNDISVAVKDYAWNDTGWANSDLNFASSGGKPVFWVLTLPGDCTDIPSVTCVPCGDYGNFYFSAEEFNPNLDFPGESMRSAESVLPIWGLPPAPPAEPPSVPPFSPYFKNGLDPWVAVLDFFATTYHGDAVRAVIDQLTQSTVGVAAFPLDDGTQYPTVAGYEGVTDLHVLVKLCEIVEISDHLGNPPLALNMSLGRLAGNLVDQCIAGGPQTPTLTCQIVGVLDHLASSTVLIASAGNHGVDMFPAAHPKVVSIGRLNLHAYDGFNGADLPYMENAPNAQGFFPGDGMRLIQPGDDYILPPGSSFSAPLFTAWVCSALVNNVPLDPLSGFPWFPRFDDENGNYLLAYKNGNSDLVVLEETANQAVNNLFNRLRELHGQNFLTPTGTLTAEVRVNFDVDSLPQANFGSLNPDPDANGCVPCDGQLPPDDLKRTGVGTESDLALDLRNSEPFGFGPEISLKAMYLQAGENYYDLKDTSGGPVFEAIRTGSLEVLGLCNVLNTVDETDQLSLIFVFGPECIDEAEDFWTSATIHVETWFNFPPANVSP